MVLLRPVRDLLQRHWPLRMREMYQFYIMISDDRDTQCSNERHLMFVYPQSYVVSVL